MMTLHASNLIFQIETFYFENDLKMIFQMWKYFVSITKLWQICINLNIIISRSCLLSKWFYMTWFDDHFARYRHFDQHNRRRISLNLKRVQRKEKERAIQ
jgi:hypothetical protein